MNNWAKKIALAMGLIAVFGMFGMASVYGLRAFLADQPAFAVIFGSGLEASKLALVISTHRQWPELGLISKAGRSIVIIALIATTSAGVLGFMWLSHNVSTGGFQKIAARKAALEMEAAAIRTDLNALESTISKWPETWVTKRLEAREGAGYYEKQARLREILNALEGLAVKKTIEYSGPVFATASILKWLPEKIAKWYVLWLVLLGEAAGFWMMVLNSRAWEEKGERLEAGGEGDRLLRSARNDGEGRGAGKNAGTANMPDRGQEASGERREAGEAQAPVFKVIAGNAENGKSGNSGNFEETAIPAKVAIPAKAAIPAKTANPANPAIPAKRQNGNSGNSVLLDIMRRYELSVHDVARTTGRSKILTVEQWVSGVSEIPEKALRELRRWVVTAGQGARG